MATGYERYRKHPVWETLQLKKDALVAARFDDAASEQGRKDIIEWLDEAVKTKGAQQPALYLSALDTLSAALNQLPVDTAQFRQFVANRQHPGQPYQQLEQALRALPLPPPRDPKATYVEQLDKEVEARNELLVCLKAQVTETEKALEARREELTAVSSEVEKLRAAIQAEREAIAEVSKAADSDMRTAWKEALETWTEERKKIDSETMRRLWRASRRSPRSRLPVRRWPSTPLATSALRTGPAGPSASDGSPSGSAPTTAKWVSRSSSASTCSPMVR
ncbi:hypothetical protein [Nocardia farcinica]|uniref:hypothetical protein n=1 Tax=Nocardia farcinica TaxID=37329 RepID=UPI002455F6AA|nr:hypothetical protein [Nocardia farcinica]